MTLFDAFRFDGKRVVVVGGASGIGAAAAELAQDAGGEVVVVDVAPVRLSGVASIHANLAERATLDAAVDACAHPIDVLMLCSGVADGTPGIERINFVGHRYLIDLLMTSGILPGGSAIGFISSTAGLGWEANLEQLKEWIAISDFDEATRWADEHDLCNYIATKQAVCAYVALQAMPFLKEGVRINAICPGPTDTPLARANADTWLTTGAAYRAEVGIDIATPVEQASVLLFLCSDAASAVAGANLPTEQGRFSAAITDAWPPDKPAVEYILGRR